MISRPASFIRRGLDFLRTVQRATSARLRTPLVPFSCVPLDVQNVGKSRFGCEHNPVGTIFNLGCAAGLLS